MKRMLTAGMTVVLAMTAACSQPDPQIAALQAEMQMQLQQMAASGATPEQVAAYQASMMQKAQTIMQQQAQAAAAQMASGNGMMNGAYAEPTEAEMRSVFEAKFGAVEDRVSDMRGQCDNVRSTNDPMVGIACLMGMAGQSQGAQVGMSSFRKIACEKSNRPGYNCDYVIGVSAAALNAFGGGGSEAQSKRFVKTDGQWIAMDY